MTDEDAGQFLAGGFNVIGECHRLIAVSEEINDNHILCIGKQIAVYICLPARITLNFYHRACFSRFISDDQEHSV